MKAIPDRRRLVFAWRLMHRRRSFKGMYVLSSNQLGTFAFRCCIWAMTILASAIVAAHFFCTGPYWYDAGWFSYLLDSNPGLVNPDGTSFYKIHVSPLLAVMSGLNCIVRAPRPVPMMIVMIGSFAVIALSCYRLFLRTPTVASAVLLSTVVLSRQVFEFLRYPHYEVMGLAFFMPLWIAVTGGRLMPAILSMIPLVMVREDMGLHVGLLFLALWAALKLSRGHGDTDHQATPAILLRLGIFALVYSAAAFAFQFQLAMRSGSQSMVEQAIIGSGEQIGVMNAVRNLMSTASHEIVELALLGSLLLCSPSAVRLQYRLLLLVPYGLWSVVCSVSQNQAMARQGSYYSFPLFFVLVVGVTLAVREWSACKTWVRVAILVLASLLLGNRVLDLYRHEVRVSASALSPSMRTFENVGAWQKLRGMDRGPELLLSPACASLWVTPVSGNRASGCYAALSLDAPDPLPDKPVLLMEHEYQSDVFFRKALTTPGDTYALNGSSFLLWVPESRRDFLATLPQAAGATKFNVFARTLTTTPSAKRIDGDFVVARGQGGCCFYGPYVSLTAGAYRVRGRVEPPWAAPFVRFDCVEHGQKPLAAQTRWHGGEFVVEFTIDSDIRDFEFRGWIDNAPVGVRLDDIELVRKTVEKVDQPESVPGADARTGESEVRRDVSS